MSNDNRKRRVFIPIQKVTKDIIDQTIANYSKFGQIDGYCKIRNQEKPHETLIVILFKTVESA